MLLPLGISAVPGRQLEHSASLQVPYQYDCADLDQNANNLFFTVIENGADIHTIVIPHTGITFPDDPLWSKVYCHPKPELVFISSLPNVWRI